MKIGAKFAYWLFWPGAMKTPLAYFNVPVEMGGGRIGMSSIPLNTVRAKGYRIPTYPSYEIWKRNHEKAA